ncbi:hypothetical protein [Leptospira ilyithenensis]|nr:hypothetical protein [Leptospira ilyithenensis]
MRSKAAFPMFQLLVTICLVAFCLFQCQNKKSDKNSTLWLNQLTLSNRTTAPYSPESCNPVSTPNDSLFSYQWHLKNTGQAMYSSLHPAGVSGNDINVVPTWSMGLSGKGTLVSIVDDGAVLGARRPAAECDQLQRQFFARDKRARIQ